MHHQHLEAGVAPGRRAGMQEDPAVGIALVPASSNPMGSHITSDCCVQRPCSAKLYALRTGRHGGQREQRLSRPSHDPNLAARKGLRYYRSFFTSCGGDFSPEFTYFVLGDIVE